MDRRMPGDGPTSGTRFRGPCVTLLRMILDCNEIIPEKLRVGCYVRPEEIRLLYVVARPSCSPHLDAFQEYEASIRGTPSG